jgi:hypothetical protein
MSFRVPLEAQRVVAPRPASPGGVGKAGPTVCGTAGAPSFGSDLDLSMNCLESSRPGLKRRLALSLLVFALGGAGRVAAETPAPLSASRLQARYLLNLPRFVEWPETTFASPDEPVVVGVLGWSNAWSVLQEVFAEPRAGGRRCELRLLESPRPEAGCHVLFVGRGSGLTPQDVRRALAAVPTLVVGETAGFAEAGGMIGMNCDSEGVRLDVNLDAVRAAGLKLRAGLSSVARVTTSPQGGPAR